MKICYLLFVSFSYAMYYSYSPSISDLMRNDELQHQGRFHLGVVISVLSKRCFIIPNESFVIKDRLNELFEYLIPAEQLMRIDEKQKLHFCSLCLKKQFAKELYEYVLYCVRECHLNKSFVSEEDMGRLLYDVGRRFFHIKTNLSCR